MYLDNKINVHFAEGKMKKRDTVHLLSAICIFDERLVVKTRPERTHHSPVHISCNIKVTEIKEKRE